jgi:hypothetical protein
MALFSRSCPPSAGAAGAAQLTGITVGPPPPPLPLTALMRASSCWSDARWMSSFSRSIEPRLPCSWLISPLSRLKMEARRPVRLSSTGAPPVGGAAVAPLKMAWNAVAGEAIGLSFFPAR